MPVAGNFAGAQMESMTVSAAFHNRFRKWIGKQRLCLEIRNDRLTAIVFVLRLFQDNFSCQGGEGDCQLHKCKFPQNNSAARFCLAPLNAPRNPLERMFGAVG